MNPTAHNAAQRIREAKPGALVEIYFSHTARPDWEATLLRRQWHLWRPGVDGSSEPVATADIEYLVRQASRVWIDGTLFDLLQ